MELESILQEYKPIDIEALEQKGNGLSENIKSSFLLYNNALIKLASSSEDIAIIELRKAISQNPEFIHAFNLLGVCYMYINDDIKAEDIFNKVINVESNGVNAYKYLKALKGEDLNFAKVKASKVKVSKVKASKVKSTQPNLSNPVRLINPNTLVKPTQLTKSTQGENSNQLVNSNQSVSASPFSNDKYTESKDKYTDSKRLFGKFLNGFISASLILIIIFTFVLVSVNKNNNIKITAEQDKIASSQSSKDSLQTQINEYKNKIAELETDTKKYSDDISKANTELDYLRNIQKLLEVEKLSLAGNFEAAGDMLLTLKVIAFEGIEKEKYDNLLKDIAPKAAWAVYNQGNTLYNSQNYKDALIKLIKVEKYAPDWQYMSWVMYQIGLSYKALGETENAITAFQKIIEKFPTSEYAVYSVYRINELKGR